MTSIPIPVIRVLKKLGQDINEARRRRRITIDLMSRRAGIARSTVGKIEQGDPGTSIGNYAMVLFILGMENRIAELVSVEHDIVGLRLEEENLPKRIRIPRHK